MGRHAHHVCSHVVEGCGGGHGGVRKDEYEIEEQGPDEEEPADASPGVGDGGDLQGHGQEHDRVDRCPEEVKPRHVSVPAPYLMGAPGGEEAKAENENGIEQGLHEPLDHQADVQVHVVATRHVDPLPGEHVLGEDVDVKEADTERGERRDERRKKNVFVLRASLKGKLTVREMRNHQRHRTR